MNEFECWYLGNKWETQDVFNHSGETLDLMCQCIKVKQDDQQYEHNVGKKVRESFPVKLKIKKSENLQWVIDNLRREVRVKGGGCVKFQSVGKILGSSLNFHGFLGVLLFHKINKNGAFHIPVPKPY